MTYILRSAQNIPGYNVEANFYNYKMSVLSIESLKVELWAFSSGG